jgi:hypothetical protein
MTPVRSAPSRPGSNRRVVLCRMGCRGQSHRARDVGAVRRRGERTSYFRIARIAVRTHIRRARLLRIRKQSTFRPYCRHIIIGSINADR